MTSQFWLILGITIVGWIGTAVIFIRKQESDNLKNQAETDKRITLLKDHHEADVKVMKEKIERCEADFHQHEIANERQFEKYHQDMNTKFDLVFKKIDELKDMFFKMAMNGKFNNE